MHARGGVAQIPREVLGEGFDGGFAHIVGDVAGRVSDSLFRAGDNDGGRGGGFADEGEEGGEAIDDSEEVGFEYLMP